MSKDTKSQTQKSKQIQDIKPYKPTNHVRIVTAASLFDGHDAAINIMRRILQSTGGEIIHLGHNRSVADVVNCAIQEDAQGIAMTSYQGGHVEYLKYMYDLLKEKKSNIKIFAGGGGTILPEEITELHSHGIDRVYSPDDGRKLGLQGMINNVMETCDFSVYSESDQIDSLINEAKDKNHSAIARLITIAENEPKIYKSIEPKILELKENNSIPVLGITGTGGAGKSSLVDEFVRRYLTEHSDKTIGIISVDPSKRKTGGALLGDRIRMNSIDNDRVYMRSLATRQSNLALSRYVQDAINILKAVGYDLVVVETSGIGQSDTEITEHSDVALYVMTSEYGAATQLEKIDMLDFADVIAINKFDKRGSLDAIRDVRKQYKRNNLMWDTPDEELPIYGTIASQFNDPGMNTLYRNLMNKIVEKTGKSELKSNFSISKEMSEKVYIIPPERVRYLAEIKENSDAYKKFISAQVSIARKMYQLKGTINHLREEIGKTTFDIVEDSEQVVSVLEHKQGEPEYLKDLISKYNELERKLDAECRKSVEEWPKLLERYKADKYQFQVRDKIIEQPLFTKSLSGTKIPKVTLPKYKDWGDILEWILTENVPGFFPFTAGVFPLKRVGEDPTRMFAGEGGPERTNKRFHYVSEGMPAKRLSTAFDSVTLYGEDPDHRPDIYGKIGNSGVSIATLDDAKKLYSGFDLADPRTSVSMTINGPAPMLMAFFLNAAIDQQCEKYIKANNLETEVESKIEKIFSDQGLDRPKYRGELPPTNNGLGLMLLGVSGDQVLEKEVYEKIKSETMSAVRGTVQADILKEDQAQNTCIFSTEFALRMMGDIQQYFIDKQVRNFYSVSISGYHIAEAGANPITQLALTLSNGFTYVEYYLSRGMNIDDFAPNLSFFFSNGVDPEYSVIGRVARRIWAKAMKNKYNGNSRSQKLKYHIQTSGRSLHAQEIAFNDIRTTLQALYAIFDNCNSLHTNAYDEAITTPTEESVRRAIAIQMIINHELGLSKNENPWQGSFVIEELTDLVEEAVYTEFNRISERGGVLGAMERMYQRTKIQEESMHYEHKKHTGELPLIGVNTFLDPNGSPTVIPDEVIRSTKEEKEFAIDTVNEVKKKAQNETEQLLKQIQTTAVENGNIFEELMEASKNASLGQMSNALYEVGGQYRRNM
ncbi:methylmalonyl-CoA mutase family protein [Candidatus Kapabacteria bacterium]|nr:methylmalonyl-CoA mutase family protein [Candidatus Kapabacteria bacterium]